MDKEFVCKRYLFGAVVVAVFVLAFSAVSYVGAYSRSVASTHSFSVSAEGEVVGIPDVARFTFSVITQGGKDISSLVTENAEKVDKAVAFLKDGGVEKKDIKTESYNVTPRYTSCYYRAGETCPPEEIVGYEISQTTSVKARDFSKAGDLLSGVVSSGANSVSSLSFEIDDPTALENIARSEAIAKAREKSRQIAKEGNFRLGKLLSVNESNYPYRLYGMGGGVAEVAPSAKVSIEPGSQKITITVNLTYEIK
jgi:hypothetical protein